MLGFKMRIFSVSLEMEDLLEEEEGEEVGRKILSQSLKIFLVWVVVVEKEEEGEVLARNKYLQTLWLR